MGDHVVFGSTLKLVTGGRAHSTGSGEALLSHAADLDVSTETHPGLDAGVMVTFPHVHVGMAARNLSAPTFGSGQDAFELSRQARIGAAFLTPIDKGLASLTVAVDADLTTQATAVGDSRRAAAGAELWLAGKRVGIRGGVSADTVGSRRPSSSLGLSLAVKPRMALDGFVSLGGDESRRGWGLGLQVAY
jgi:hypothetical protein